MKRLVARLCASGLLVAAMLSSAWGRQITDMAGRKVAIPNRVTRVYAADPYTSVLLYTLAPDLLVGIQPGRLEIGPEQRRFLRKEAVGLPMLGTSGGQASQVNLEEVVRLRPDLILAIGARAASPLRVGDMPRTEERFARIRAPLVFVDLDAIEDYPAGLDFVGKLVGRSDRARSLSQYARQALARVQKAVAAIPPAQRVRVYYAESVDGLATESDRSLHVDAIRMAGGSIVHRGDIKTHMGMEKISLEQVLLYDPEVIISQEPDFAAHAYHDPRWQKVRAVAHHRIYTIPRTPFDWIDRPPSVMRILGVQWLAYRFYPTVYRVDMRKETRQFCRLFLGIEVADAELDAWLR